MKTMEIVLNYLQAVDRFDIVPVSNDELLLKSSGIGDQYLRKVNGKWEWQQEEIK